MPNNLQTIKFICSKCGVESWFRVNIDIYIISDKDLVCDDCNPIEGKEEILIAEAIDPDYNDMNEVLKEID